MQKDMIIGLCGGIGSGKSAAAQILSDMGAYIIDTDQIARSVISTSCLPLIKREFPDCFTGEELDRAKLKSKVFADKTAREKLNQITHPYIIDSVKNEAYGKGVVVVQAPLLFESGFDKMCDLTVAVIAPLAERKRRVMRRDGMTAELFEAIVSSQLSDQSLIEKCEFGITNNGSFKQLEENVKWFYTWIKEELSRG